mmetsp:Transcript_106203/g.307384  ORF Transcript_106203/g.307384 Transcript_106203/m.307384 type:complete len:236 (-) Transcript_106203:2489-3196(-)
MGLSRNTAAGFLLFASLAPTTAWWSVSAASSFFSRGSRSFFTAASVASATPAECASVETALGSNTDLLTDKQNAMVASLLALDQEHLFEDWPPLGKEDVEKKRLLKQLESLDQSYPGGLETYITKARDLLESSARGDNPFDGMTPSVPTGEDLEYGDEEYKSMEKLGLEVTPAPTPAIRTLAIVTLHYQPQTATAANAASNSPHRDRRPPSLPSCWWRVALASGSVTRASSWLSL